jgi:hypothetical protein
LHVIDFHIFKLLPVKALARKASVLYSAKTSTNHWKYTIITSTQTILLSLYSINFSCSHSTFTKFSLINYENILFLLLLVGNLVIRHLTYKGVPEYLHPTIFFFLDIATRSYIQIQPKSRYCFTISICWLV